MYIADVATLVDQVQSRPVAVLVGAPGCPVIVLRHSIRHIQVNDSLFQVAQVALVRKLRIMIADDDQTLVFVLVVPFPQRGNYVLAVYSTEGPHIDGNDFAAQVGQSQWGIHI